MTPEAVLIHGSHLRDDRSSFLLLKKEWILKYGYKAWVRGRSRDDRGSDRTQICRRVKKGVQPIHDLGMVERRRAVVG